MLNRLSASLAGDLGKTKATPPAFLAQLEERLAVNRKVDGSKPSKGVTKRKKNKKK
jgi:hypothetical protein